MPELPNVGPLTNEEKANGTIGTNNRGGNDTEYTLRRLKRDAPELLQAVKRGELSVNAAAIQGGNRKRSEAMTGVPRAAKGEKRKADVADHCDLRPSPSGRNVAREASAAEAKVSPATINLVSNCSNLFHLLESPKNLLYTPTKRATIHA